MRTLLLAGLIALSLAAGSASAASRLSDTQMDQISAGAFVPTCGGASNCSSVSATSSSMVATVTNTSGQLETLATAINEIICGGTCSPSSTPPMGAPATPSTNTTTTVGNGSIGTPPPAGSAAGTVVSINGLTNP